MDERNYSMDTKDNDNQYRLRVVLIFPQGQWTERNASTREITPREKSETPRLGTKMRTTDKAQAFDLVRCSHNAKL